MNRVSKKYVLEVNRHMIKATVYSTHPFDGVWHGEAAVSTDPEQTITADGNTSDEVGQKLLEAAVSLVPEVPPQQPA